MASLPLHPLTSPDDSQPEFPWFQSSSFGGKPLFRTRRRVIFWLFGATFALIILYTHWQQPLGEERYFESCQSLDPQIPCVPEIPFDSPPHTVTITQTAPPTTKTMVVESPVEPVVFALIMYSESSAMEGAVLLKVLCYVLVAASCNTVLFFRLLLCTLHDPFIFTSSATEWRGYTWRLDSAFSHTRYITSPCAFTSCHTRPCEIEFQGKERSTRTTPLAYVCFRLGIFV
jgi:hypothetical protein